LPAATIGQVHGAVLLNGDRVVIKFQYPEVEELFHEDLETVALFCRLLQPEMSPMMDEMARQFKTEFDFAREASGDLCEID
jgi:predicted unusual protein kinase regulating ubiquinone biosynthesis (AarF/ABC1/UbiB family)